MLSRLSRGELVSAVAGLALLVITFLSWYQLGGGLGEAAESVPGYAPPIDETANAWQSFDFIDVVLLATILAAILPALLSLSLQPAWRLPIQPGQLIATLGGLATLLVLYAIVNPPDLFPPGPTDRQLGLYLGLLACVGVALSGWITMQGESGGRTPREPLPPSSPERPGSAPSRPSDERAGRPPSW